MCLPLAGPSTSKSSYRSRNCTHLSVSALTVTSGCWRTLVWRSTPRTSSTCSASGKFQPPGKSTTPWPMLQAASSTHSTKAWRRRWTGKTTNCGGTARCQTYARIDAYTMYKSWKTIDNIVTGWDISKEQEADPYYHCNFVDEDAWKSAFVLLALQPVLILVVSDV